MPISGLGEVPKKRRKRLVQMKNDCAAVRRLDRLNQLERPAFGRPDWAGEDGIECEFHIG
jgi:hypothetical protein